MGVFTDVLLEQEHGTYIVPTIKMNRGLRTHRFVMSLNTAQGLRQVELSGPGQQSSLGTVDADQSVGRWHWQGGHRRPVLLQERANPRYGLRPVHRAEQGGRGC